jgi:hypothetical protein
MGLARNMKASKTKTLPAALACLGLTLTLGHSLGAQEQPGTRYVDPSQLDVPWPRHSFVKVPWRAFLETKTGDDFLRGIGVNYNVPGKSDLAVRLLAETGFRAFRIEAGWGSVRWDEDGLHDEDQLRWLLTQCRCHGIRPTLLLNAHHGVPCPLKAMDRKLAADAPRGSRRIKLTDTAEIVAGRTGVSNLTEYWAAQVLITRVDRETGECELSKPLPKGLTKGQDVRLMTLKYLPLHPVGTKEFDETAAGWVRFALLVCKHAHEAGFDDFDVEVWNELTFGTHFLNVNDSYDPPAAEFKKDPLHEGGQMWELARRTVDAVKRRYPGARCIWGFSNTTFFHTRIEELPPGTDGQSYHPYGTGTHRYPRDEDYRDKPEMNVDGFTPAAEWTIPEGLAHTFIKTESLMRLLNPEARRRHPPGVQRFYHFMTEHGVAPAETGAKDAAAAWRLKTLCALRSYCLWLNKGIDTVHYFSAYEDKALGMGLLPPNLKELPPDAEFDTVATPPMKAVRNLTRAFSGSTPLRDVRALQADVSPLGRPGNVFEGKVSLGHPDVLAVLPFQVSEKRHVLAVYVSTYDATSAMPEERYRLSVQGFSALLHAARLYDPVTDRSTKVEIVRRGGEAVDLELAVADYPRLLILE